MSPSYRGLLLVFLVLGCGDDSDPATEDETSSSADDTTSSTGGTTSSDTTTSSTDTTSSAGMTSAEGDASSSEADASSSDADASSSDSGTTELDCLGVFECVTACPDEDDACVDTCLEGASEAALELVEDVLVCAQSNGCGDEACLAEDCGPELLACAGEVGCDGTGKPELTEPIAGLQASYGAGDPIEVIVAVDEDTARVTVGVYEVGSTLYLGGTAQDVAPSSTVTLDLFAGVVDGATGEFYVSIELCSTSTCTTPVLRNTYQRADRTAPLGVDETYVQTRESIGGDETEETCPSSIPIQTFLIE